MRLATIVFDGSEHLAIDSPIGCVTMKRINEAFDRRWPTDMAALIETNGLATLNAWYAGPGHSLINGRQDLFLDQSQVVYAPLYRHPPKIWGIGLNYREHAADLSAQSPTSAPASFMKPSTTIIGYGDVIQIPRLSQRTTAEAELGVVIGKRCRDVPRDKWLAVVAGFTSILDMTAEDILQENPRFLTRSKSFDTFFSFGPQLITPDEIGDLNNLKVATIINDKVHAENIIANMTFTPDLLVSYHSQVMTLLPGDIISTGTPGAVPVHHGDVVQCRIADFTTLVNPVVDLKKQAD